MIFVALALHKAFYPAECAAFQLVQALAALEESEGKGGVPPLPRYTVALLKNVRDRARGGSVGLLTAACTWGSIEAAIIQTGDPEGQLGAEVLLEAALQQTLADTEPTLAEERKESDRKLGQMRAATVKLKHSASVRKARLAVHNHIFVHKNDPVELVKRMRGAFGDETLAGVGLTAEFMQGLVDVRQEQLATAPSV
jgi:hypothetical protein